MMIPPSLFLLLAPSRTARDPRPPGPATPSIQRDQIMPAAFLVLTTPAAATRVAGPTRFASVAIRVGPDPRQSTTV